MNLLASFLENHKRAQDNKIKDLYKMTFKEENIEKNSYLPLPKAKQQDINLPIVEAMEDDIKMIAPLSSR